VAVLLQLDGCEAWDDNEPYTLNLGGGTGYAFLSEDGLEGRFYWDSV
jgi:hypothetical protein